MKNYLELLSHVMEHGTFKDDRTGTGTKVFLGTRCALTLAKVSSGHDEEIALRSIIHELLWFIKGDTNIGYLKDNKVSIWDEWANENGDLGPVYGAQWRHWRDPDGGEVDQLQELLSQLKTNPDSRRHIISAWNVADLPKMALMPCTHSFNFT